MAGVEAPLEPGMVVTVEPKLIDPERGAVMVEDDYLITGDGVERLSVADRELFEVPHE
jgi:Xaa-Pro aminopeptidase